MRLLCTIPLGRPVTNLVYTQRRVDSRPLKSSGVMTLCGEPWWCRWPWRPWFGCMVGTIMVGNRHLYGHNWSTYAGHVMQVQVDCGYNRPEGWLVSVDGLDLSWWRGSADLVCAGLRSTLLAHCPLLTPAAQLTLSSGCCVKSLFWRIEGSQIDFVELLYFCELRARAFWSQNKGMVWLGSFRQI